MLRLAYAFAQVLLYRPFLHFVATDKRSQQIDQRAYTCAASYVNVARNIIHLCTQMKQKGLLNGAFWFIMYTTFFSIMSLVYFAAENPDNPTTEALMKDALEGKEVLASIAKRSMAADRCTVTLNASLRSSSDIRHTQNANSIQTVFSRLPQWMREGRPNPTHSRKRRQGSDIQPMHQATNSHPDIGATARDDIQPLQQRSNTFPHHKPKANIPRVNTQAFDPTMSSTPQAQSRVPSNGPYTPASASYAQQAFAQPDTSPLAASMQNIGMPMNNMNPDLPDLSAMMFPSAEPLTYPNQPLTTFENNRFAKGPPYYNTNMNAFNNGSTVMQGRPGNQVDSDDMEAQLFSLPPYMMQNQWNMDMQAQQARQQQPLASAAQQPLGVGQMAPNLQWQNQQQFPQGQGYDDIDLNGIFGGGEWANTLMDQYGHGR